MRKKLYIALMATLVISLKARSQSFTPLFNLQNTFTNIPDSVQTSVYWYWLSDNISEEGVVKDLEAMKKVGINRAFIGNIGMGGMPQGKIKMFSDEWWNILHAALKTATRLGIQIGIFNSPGWSQSGGPWIKPEQSMRYLTSSEIMVEGPAAVHKTLVKPADEFQDVRVLAYPVPRDYYTDISSLKPQLSSEPAIDSLWNLTDHNGATAIHINAGKLLTVRFDTKMPYMVRSLVIDPGHQNVRLEGDLFAKINNRYTIVKHFSVDRSNSALNVGFRPFGPLAVSVPSVTSGSFKIVFTSVSSDAAISGIQLSSVPVVESYIEKTLAKMWPTPHPLWNAYLWPTQPAEISRYVIDPAKTIDISKYMSVDGTLDWQAPPGNWIIERTGMTSTNVTNSPAPPQGTGLEVDKMSKQHVGEHFEAYMGKILERIPAEDRKTWKVVVEDSYETGSQNWTDNLIPEFRARYHYDPVPYIPVMQGKVVGSEDKSDRFLWDLRRLIADDVSFNYVGGLREISHRHGLTTWLENYGHWGYPGEFLQYGGQSDEVGGEFWTEGDLGDIENRAAASSAHIYGKIKVSAESFTAGGAPFRRYPAMLKQRGDRFFTEGINNTLLHVYISQPQDTLAPGLNTWFGTEFNRLNTWFADMDVWLAYLKRCNFMLQQGRYVADAAYFIGEDAPKMIGVTDPVLPHGYSFDYINADIIKDSLAVKGGRLVLPNGISYGILVLPKQQAMRPELLTKIRELVAQGAVVLGPKPTRSPSLENYPNADKQVQSMADELWGGINGNTVKVNRYGQGQVLSNMNMQEAFNLLGIIPDMSTGNTVSPPFIHRRLEDGEIYFLSNQKNDTAKFTAVFRTTGKTPELWDAVSGKVRDLPAYTDDGIATSVPLTMIPGASAFIVFRKDGGEGDLSKSNEPVVKRTIGLNLPWTVYFSNKTFGPAAPVTLNKLTDWTKFENDSIKYYSGTATYHNSFRIDNIAKTDHYVIDLGMVHAIAKVVVNGVEAGGVWTAPYQVDITRELKRGVNKLEVRVVNTWVNRLIGDSRLPAAQRKTSVLSGPAKDEPLEPSGLTGPVVIKQIAGAE